MLRHKIHKYNDYVKKEPEMMDYIKTIIINITSNILIHTEEFEFVNIKEEIEYIIKESKVDKVILIKPLGDIIIVEKTID